MRNGCDFLIERRLKELSPDLHQRFTSCVMLMPSLLNHYVDNFPDFTDHSMRHALDVIEFCNQIAGVENVSLMNEYELFTLLMGVYLHDIGMGITENDFRTIYAEQLKMEIEVKALSTDEVYRKIRKLHHELSGVFVRKYGSFFELNNERLLWAVVQIVRGHRVTDLSDEAEYPLCYPIDGEKSICLPYLAALIRLADEIDVGVERNSIDMYVNAERNLDDHAKLEFARHLAVRRISVEDDAFLIYIDGPEDILQAVLKEGVKIQATLDQCLAVVNGRTGFTIRQKYIRFIRV